jgi:GT2 family glycosyltransferase
MRLKLAVVIATRNRVDCLGHILKYLSAQTRKPDIACVSGVDEADVSTARADFSFPVKVVFGPPGLAAQRNTGVQAVVDHCDVIVFFDDDFLPSRRWLERLEALFNDYPLAMGIDGRTLADGAEGAGLTVEHAARLLREYKHHDAAHKSPLEPCKSLYGCNMAYRSKVFESIWFDDRLPLYAWLEDRDFSSRVAMLGDLFRSKELVGVHLGIRSGRVSGVKLGISQVINPIYLFLKGTLGISEATRVLVRPLLKNILRAFWPEPHIDRRGRLWGNIVGIAYLISGRVDPGIVTRMKS